MTMNKNIFISAMIITFSLLSCSKKEAENKEFESEFTATTALVKDTVFTKEYVSQIRSLKNIEIRAQEKGYLEKVYVDEGQYVHAGQPLFKTMASLHQVDLLKAQAEAKAAQIELGNTKLLADKNVVSKKEQELAKARLDQANAEVALAKLHLSFTVIRAPFSGTIDRIPKKLGSLIDEGELLTSLSDNSQIYAYFNVSEPEYLQYQQNVKDRGDSHVNLKLANDEMFQYTGNVEVIESEFDPETGNISFRAKFPNSEKLLKNGQTGKILMNVPVKNAMIIPQKATYEIQDKKYVFVLDKNNKAVSREITTSGEFPDLYVVKSGLTAQDKFLLEGVQNVKEGQKVSYKLQNPKTVISKLRLKAE